MDIQAEIFGVLAPEEEEVELRDDLKPLEISSGIIKLSPDDISNILHQAKKAIADDNSEEAVYLLGCVFASHASYNSYKYRKMTLGAIQYHRFPEQELKEALLSDIEELIEERAQREREMMISSRFGSFDSIIDYLNDFFGDNLESEIIDLSGVSKATARRYTKGHSPRGDYYDMFRSLAKLFYVLSTENNKTNEEVIEWYRKEPINERGESVREIISATNYFSYGLHNNLEKKGITF